MNWSPDGADIMISQGPDSGRYDALLIINPAGRVVRQLPEVRPNPDNLVWGPDGLAVGNGLFHSGPNEVLSLSGRVRYTVPGGWVPMCWNPAGNAMIAFRAPHEIGLWRLARPGTVRALGPLPIGGLLECRWLSRPAAGT